MLYVLYDLARRSLQEWQINRIFQILDQVAFRALAAALVAFMVVVLAGRPVIRRLGEMKIGDTGLTDADALRAMSASKANTPTMGGVLIVGAIIAATVLLADFRNFYIYLGLVVAIWLAVLGGVDDWLKQTQRRRSGGGRQGLRAWEKLIFQLGIGVLVGFFVYSHADTSMPQDLGHVLNLPFQKTYTSPLGAEVNPGVVFLSRGAFVLIAMLMVAGMSNAVNLTDGMDGLAAGITTAVSVGMVTLVVIAGTQTQAQRLLIPFIADSAELLVLAASMVGACLGFLWWNAAPAQVFMGDTGSLPLGGLLAYLAVVVRQEVLLLIMGAVFIVEIASVILQVGYFKYTKVRTGSGRRLFRVAPIHHHFHVLGWTENQVVVRAWIVTMLCIVIALTLIKAR